MIRPPKLNVLSFILFPLVVGCESMSMLQYNSNDFHPRTRAFREDHLRKYAPIESKDFKFENSDLIVSYTPTIEDAALSVKIENRSQKNIKILWDESTFVDAKKNADGIFHTGIVIHEREKPQTPTLIPPGAVKNDDLVPKAKPFLYLGKTWLYEPLCGVVDLATPSNLNATHRLDDTECIGKTFTFNLAYEIEGQKKNAKLSFKLDSKEISNANVAK